MSVDLIICHHLLKGQLEGIADIMEQRGESPVFEKCDRRLVLSSQTVKLFESLTVILVGLVDRQTQRKHIYRVGVMIAVLHQKRAAVRLELREKLDHLLALAVVTEEDLEIAVIDVICVLGYAGVDKVLQLALEAQAVYIHLHIVGDLIFADTATGEFAGVKFAVLFRIELQPLAAIMDKAQRGALQIKTVGSKEFVRLKWSDVLAETIFVVFSHFR